jgi:uncharacterized membrane protein
MPDASFAPASSHSSAAGSSRTPRIRALDAARGVALAAMILFHFTWDLDFFGWLPSGALGDGFHWLGHAIAAVFLVIVGSSLALAGREGLAAKPFLRRLALVGAAAALVTIATWIVLPDEYIWFGILHCIVVASVAAAPFLRQPIPVVALAAALSLAAPLALASHAMDASWIQWLGLGMGEPLTNDWAPFFPAFGFVLAGLTAVRIASKSSVLARAAQWRPHAIWARLPVFAGRHSLLIYLTHQPLLLGLLFVVGFATGRPPPSETGAFERSCETQCMGRGSDRPFCSKVCGCVVGRGGASPWWPHVLDDKLSAREHIMFDGVVQECFEGVGSP